MAAVAASEMITAARQLTGNETLDEANAFVTNAELLAVLNGELAELHDTVVEHHDDAYFFNIDRVTLENGKDTYPLSLAVYKITGVDVVWSDTVRRTAKRFMDAERNRFRTMRPAWGQFCEVFFQLQGDNIVFLPTPQNGVPVDVRYIPQFVPLVALTDTFNVPNGWHWMAIWGVARYIRQKDADEISAQLADNAKQAQKQRVVAMAASRIEGEPMRVQRTRRYDDEDLF